MSMKDPRFLPVDKRDPVDEYEDEFLGSDEELYEAIATGKEKASIKRIQLYIAS